MRAPRPSDTLRLLLIATLGASPLACQSSSGGANGDGDSTTSSGGASMGGSSAGGTAAGGSVAPAGLGCTNPQPRMEGHDTGFVKCDEGYLVRTSVKQCPVSLPLEEPLPLDNLGGGGGGFPVPDDECASNADCAHLGDLGYCTQAYVGFGYPYLKCDSGCDSDEDCGPDSLCVCGASVGRCERIDNSTGTGCRANEDCSDGAVCAGVTWTLPCDGGYRAFSCTPPADECTQVEGCAAYEDCELLGSSLICSDGSVCGRPFLIQSDDRKADLHLREDWVSSGARHTTNYTENEGRIAAKHFERVALMEHASIAAFARFSLQLLSLGAPAEFIEETNQALIDETKHARLAFDLVARFDGKNYGPGPLDVSGALSDTSIESILVTTILEGCIGETLAALEAQTALFACEDEEVRVALTTIAKDETRHAKLAWKVVQWILSEHPELHSLAQQTFTNASKVQQTSTFGDQDAAPRLGVLGKRELDEVHADAWQNVIRPCSQTLLTRSISGQSSQLTSRASLLA